MKKYTIIAGVNGAGKSTFYDICEELKSIPRVNSDEIVRAIGNWENPKDFLQAGKIAVQQIEKYIMNGISFNQETTLCGKSILKSIKKAKEHGFYIEMHYIGLENPEIAKERIKYRVLKGGHGIPNNVVERRYNQSFENLRNIMPFCDYISFYDNSNIFEFFAEYEQKKIRLLSEKPPCWFEREILNTM